MRKIPFVLMAVMAVFLAASHLHADTLAITNFTRSGTNTALQFQPVPSAVSYAIFSATNLNSSFAINTNFSLVPYGGPEIIIDNTSAIVVGPNWSTGTS